MKLSTAILLMLACAPLAAQEEIDQAILAGAGGPLAPRSGDAEFLRRVWLDLAGTIPTAGETRAFLADRDPKKREKIIDRLLLSPEHPRRMGQALTVMLLERRGGTRIPDPAWSEYLRKAFAANEPWDRVVRSMIAADGRAEETRPAMKFLADGAGGDQHRMTNDVGRLLLGRNLLCAQCHDHPTINDYKQSEYMGLFAYLNQSKVQDDPKTKKPIMVETAAPGKVEFASVFSAAKKHHTGPRLPGSAEIDVPKFEKGKEYETPPTKDAPGVPKFRPRELLAEGLIRHPYFARNSVNRFWFVFMGRGLIHPLDLDHRANPPSHPALLDELTMDFMQSGFNVRDLVRKILLSEAYQRSSVLAGDPPPQTYRAAIAKPLSAEQLAWSLMKATGMQERIQTNAGSSKFSTKDYLSGRNGTPPSNLPDVLRLFADVFGNAPGEPEVEFVPSMTHALFLMNERLVLDWVKPREGNLVDRLRQLPDSQAAEELYLSVLTRLPESDERAEVSSYLERNKARRDAALGELAWALLASTEFRLNH